MRKTTLILLLTITIYISILNAVTETRTLYHIADIKTYQSKPILNTTTTLQPGDALVPHLFKVHIPLNNYIMFTVPSDYIDEYIENLTYYISVSDLEYFNPSLWRKIFYASPSLLRIENNPNYQSIWMWDIVSNITSYKGISPATVSDTNNHTSFNVFHSIFKNYTSRYWHYIVYVNDTLVSDTEWGVNITEYYTLFYKNPTTGWYPTTWTFPYNYADYSITLHYYVQTINYTLDYSDVSNHVVDASGKIFFYDPSLGNIGIVKGDFVTGTIVGSPSFLFDDERWLWVLKGFNNSGYLHLIGFPEGWWIHIYNDEHEYWWEIQEFNEKILIEPGTYTIEVYSTKPIDKPITKTQTTLQQGDLITPHLYKLHIPLNNYIMFNVPTSYIDEYIENVSFYTKISDVILTDDSAWYKLLYASPSFIRIEHSVGVKDIYIYSLVSNITNYSSWRATAVTQTNNHTSFTAFYKLYKNYTSGYWHYKAVVNDTITVDSETSFSITDRFTLFYKLPSGWYPQKWIFPWAYPQFSYTLHYYVQTINYTLDYSDVSNHVVDASGKIFFYDPSLYDTAIVQESTLTATIYGNPEWVLDAEKWIWVLKGYKPSAGGVIVYAPKGYWIRIYNNNVEKWVETTGYMQVVDIPDGYYTIELWWEKPVGKGATPVKSMILYFGSAWSFASLLYIDPSTPIDTTLFSDGRTGNLWDVSRLYNIWIRINNTGNAIQPKYRIFAITVSTSNGSLLISGYLLIIAYQNLSYLLYGTYNIYVEERAEPLPSDKYVDNDPRLNLTELQTLKIHIYDDGVWIPDAPPDNNNDYYYDPYLDVNVVAHKGAYTYPDTSNLSYEDTIIYAPDINVTYSLSALISGSSTQMNYSLSINLPNLVYKTYVYNDLYNGVMNLLDNYCFTTIKYENNTYTLFADDILYFEIENSGRWRNLTLSINETYASSTYQHTYFANQTHTAILAEQPPLYDYTIYLDTPSEQVTVEYTESTTPGGGEEEYTQTYTPPPPPSEEPYFNFPPSIEKVYPLLVVLYITLVYGLSRVYGVGLSIAIGTTLMIALMVFIFQSLEHILIMLFLIMLGIMIYKKWGK